MNIYERMSAVTNDVKKLSKDTVVGTGSMQYKAISETAILNAVRGAEQKHGVYSYPVDRDIVFDNVYEIEKAGHKPNDPPKISFKFFLRMKTTYRFVNIEKPTEFIDMVSYGDGVDPQDKAPGKAMTYADKYALMKAYKIMTGDDPDQSPSDMGNKKQGNGFSTPKMPELTEEELRTQQLRLQAQIDKKKLPDELLVEAGNDTPLWTKVMSTVVKDLGYAKYNDINFMEISKVVFKGKFIAELGIQKKLIEKGI